MPTKTTPRRGRRSDALIRANAAAPRTDDLQLTAAVTIEAAAAGGDRPGPRRFEILAYTGGLLHLPNFEYPVVVDLANLTGTDKPRPVLKDHNRALLVGHTDRISNDGRRLTAAGVVSGDGPAAREVVGANDRGFPWQASIGAKMNQREFVAPGRRVAVNGQTFEGPVIVARRARLGEISFVVLGADDQTSARIAAGAAGDSTMTFEEWLAQQGIEAAGLSDAVMKQLRARHQSEIEAADAGDGEGDDDDDSVEASDGDDAGEGDDEGDETVEASDDADEDPAAAAVQATRTALARDRRRVAQLGTIAERYRASVPAARLATIEASAIERGWDANRFELNLIRAERPESRGGQGGRTGNGARGGANAQVIEAALSLSAGVPEEDVAEAITASDRERVMNLATARDMRGYGLHTLMDAVIHAAGMHYGGTRRSDGYVRTVLQAEQSIQASGFTSLSLSGILSNVANKGLISAYTAVEVVWNEICAVRSHGDFKVHTRYRLDSTGAFKKVGADGELKHVGLGEASFTNQVATYGAIVALTRQMMVNDDLGAFMDIPTFLGRMAALRIEEAVFVLLLANTGSFFHANNANLLTGAGSAFGLAALTASEKAFRDQVDSNGKPVLISPKRVLVGTALKVDADNIFAEKLLITGEAATKTARNPHVGKYPPVCSPYVNNTAIKDQDGAAIANQSATKWWMLADPAQRAALAVAFLNGQQTPTIESAQTDFNTLGMNWRAFHDFGVAFEDPKACVQNNGV